MSVYYLLTALDLALDLVELTHFTNGHISPECPHLLGAYITCRLEGFTEFAAHDPRSQYGSIIYYLEMPTLSFLKIYTLKYVPKNISLNMIRFGGPVTFLFISAY